MNFVKLYIGDYLRDTGTLTLAQHGAYTLMLLDHYASEKPLPVGRELYRLLRAESKAERDAIDFVAGKFWQLTEAGLTNGRATKEIAKASEISDTNRAIALTREARKRTRTEHEACSERAENVPRTEHERSTLQTTRHQTPEKERESGAPPKPSARGARLSADWRLPDEWRAWAQRKRPDLDVERTAENFADFWHAKSGQDATKLDWLATWRRWVREERTPQANGANGSHVSSVLTVPSKAAEITAAQLHSDTMTPEQSEAARQAARLAMAKLGRIAA